MSSGNSVLRFEDVYFGHSEDRLLMENVSFSLRDGAKMTVMGQNGAGKSTMFKLILWELVPFKGRVNREAGATIAIARQVMPHEDRELTLQEYFRKYHRDKEAHNVDRDINKALQAVNFSAPLDRVVKSFSGGQQARLLLAAAIVQDPDILLLDEPTNNLDTAGIEHLTDFLKSYKNTVVVISHDAEFLNAFTDGVYYLDVFTQKIETYMGNYHKVVADIAAQIEKENRANSRMEKEAIANKEQANVFAHKGWKLRLVAKKMREKAEELEESMVDVRREDKTIREFTIPMQEDIGGVIISIKEVNVIKNHTPVPRTVEVSLGKDRHLLLSGPNGIGKSTLLESVANGTAPKMFMASSVRVGYYRQDFSTLDFNQTVHQCLSDALKASGDPVREEMIRKTAAGFLIDNKLIMSRIGDLSEGQKGLVSFARLVLLKPGLLILDEPTNHINFRHIPVIAQALDQYEGAMILVSHVDEFVWQVRIDDYLDLD